MDATTIILLILLVFCLVMLVLSIRARRAQKRQKKAEEKKLIAQKQELGALEASIMEPVTGLPIADGAFAKSFFATIDMYLSVMKQCIILISER